MKGVLAGEDEELAREQGKAAEGAALARLDDRVPLLQQREVRLDVRRRPLRPVHVPLQRVDLARVVLERGADLFFEVVDDDEVGEERD